MTARTPSAFLLSATVHVAVALLILGVAFLAQHRAAAPQPAIFELVAGEGDNYGATEAPALGVAGGVKFAPPRPAAPAPAAASVTPVAPAPTPVVAVKPPPAAKPPVSLTTMINKVISRKVAVAEKQVQKQQAEEAKQLTKAEFDKANAAKNAAKASTTPVKVPRIDGEGIAKGVAGGSTDNKVGGAGGTALTREQSDVLTAYFAMLKERLSAAHQKPDGLSSRLQAQAEFHLNADGSITGVRILVSSGNEAFDQSVLAAFKQIAPMPRPPDGKAVVRTVTSR